MQEALNGTKPRFWRNRRWQASFAAILLISLLSFLLPTALSHAASNPYPVFGNDVLSTFTYKEHNVVQPGSPNIKMVSVSGQPFTTALEATSPEGFQLPNDSSAGYQITIQAPTTAAVTQNDVLQAKFWLRQVSSSVGQAQATATFQRAGGDYAKSFLRLLSLGTEWKQYTFTFRASNTFAPGEAEFAFWLGYAPPQTIALGGFSITDLGPDAPLPPPTYEGRESDAPWRAVANQRIEQYRKGNLNITVRDQSGNPIPNASVHVQMLNHTFNFGTAAPAFRIVENNADNQTYREKLVQLFNLAELENDLKWPAWEDAGWRTNTLPAVQWLQENGFKIRGHNFVWSTPWNQLIGDEGALVSNPAALSNRIDNHIRNEAGTLRGKITDWDVVNELYWGPSWLSKLGGNAAIAHWFEVAKDSDPKAQLSLNDFNFWNNDGTIDKAQFDYYKNLIQYLHEHDAPVDRLGVESHMTVTDLPSPEQVVTLLDQIAALGVKPQITEFDMPTTDLQLQADYTRDFLTAVFSDPNVDTLNIWGFWDGNIWQPNAGLFDQNWKLKPNGQVWLDLLYHQWWTDVTGTTGTNGKYSTRGFQGDYQIDVTVNGKTNRVKTTLGKGTKNVTVNFDPALPTPAPNQPRFQKTPTPAPAPLTNVFTPQRGSTLLTNGDFEQGTQNWFTFGGSPFSAVQSPVHGGGNAALSSARQAFWQGPAQTVSVRNGDTYNSSVWVRLAPGSVPTTVSVAVKVETDTNPDGFYFGLGSAQVTADSWTQITGSAQINWTGTLKVANWWMSTAWDGALVDFYVDDASLQGAGASGTRTVVANHAQWIDGTINGSLQQLQSSDVTIDPTASITRGLYVPGAPLIRPNGSPLLTTELPNAGNTNPTDKVITVNGKGRLDYVVSRTDPYTLTPVATIPLPTGNNDVVLNRAGQTISDFTSLRDLTVNRGEISIPGGTYGVFVANSGSTLTLGTAGSTTPTVYNLQGLKINPGATLKVVGPVVLNVEYGAALNGTAGAAQNPLWLTINVAQEGVGINGTSYGLINAPTTEVTVNGKLTGRIVTDLITLNPSGVVTDPDVASAS